MDIEHEVERISLAIEDAIDLDNGNPVTKAEIDGARNLAEVWSKLDKLEAFAEARLRLVLRHLPEPAIAQEVPSWLEEGIHAVFDVRPHLAAVVDSAGRLALAFLHKHPSAIATVDLADPMTIALRWNDTRGLRFMVSRPTLRWPAVNARAYWHKDPYEAPLECRYARLAYQLLELPYEADDKGSP
jgi:hypothetical protein